MTRTTYYTAQFVESFPAPMESGVLYVSMTYSTAGHICPCGCSREVVTKLSPARWRVIFDGEVSLKPSVAATGLPCNSHYFITRGEVDWRPQLDGNQAARAQAVDRRAVEALRAPVPAQPHHSERRSWWSRITRRPEK
jgi:hypothetical protein